MGLFSPLLRRAERQWGIKCGPVQQVFPGCCRLGPSFNISLTLGVCRRTLSSIQLEGKKWIYFKNVSTSSVCLVRNSTATHRTVRVMRLRLWFISIPHLQHHTWLLTSTGQPRPLIPFHCPTPPRTGAAWIFCCGGSSGPYLLLGAAATVDHNYQRPKAHCSFILHVCDQLANWFDRTLMCFLS